MAEGRKERKSWRILTSPLPLSRRLRSWCVHGIGPAYSTYCVPNLLRWLDLPDIIAAIAPRPLFFSQEVRNTPAQCRRDLAPIRRAYRALDAGDNLTVYMDNANQHRFIGQPANDWIGRL